MHRTADAALEPETAAMAALADACRGDAELRARIETEPRAVLSEHGIELPASVEARVVSDTDDIFHMIMPPDPNMELGDEALRGVAAGTQTASSGGTVGTLGCLPSCIGSASSLGTAGSLGPNS